MRTGTLTGVLISAPWLLRARRRAHELRRDVSTLEQRLAVVSRLTEHLHAQRTHALGRPGERGALR